MAPFFSLRFSQICVTRLFCDRRDKIIGDFQQKNDPLKKVTHERCFRIELNCRQIFGLQSGNLKCQTNGS